MVSTLIAAVAAMISAFAIRAVVSVDRNVAQRAKEREDRDRMPLAVAIQHDIHTVLGFIDSMSEIQKRFPKSPEIVCERLIESRDRARMPAIEQYLAQLGCFDASLGRKLSGAFTMSRIIYRNLGIETSDKGFIKAYAAHIVEETIRQAEGTRKAFHEADEAISPISNIAPYKTSPALVAIQAAHNTEGT